MGIRITAKGIYKPEMIVPEADVSNDPVLIDQMWSRVKKVKVLDMLTFLVPTLAFLYFLISFIFA